MIKEVYCSFEVSKLLKEKGFNEKCRGGYHYEFDDNDNIIVMFEEWMAQPYNNDVVDEGFLCSAPTHQMAMDWLREVHKVFIVIDAYHADHWEGYIDSFEIRIYSHASTIIVPNEIAHHTDYTEAVEAALKYSLENLI